jgi:hypothetical protein
MKVGTLEVEWHWGEEFARDILMAIGTLATTNLKRIDLDGGVKVYKAGTIVRVDIPEVELM